jgi:hypothetical protein
MLKDSSTEPNTLSWKGVRMHKVIHLGIRGPEWLRDRWLWSEDTADPAPANDTELTKQIQ